MPEMSLEEQALRHADEFFTGPEKWNQGCSLGPSGSICVGMALANGFAFEARLVCECTGSQLRQISEALGFTGLYRFADWNDDLCPNFATMKARLKTRIEFYQKQRLKHSYLIVIGPKAAKAAPA